MYNENNQLNVLAIEDNIGDFTLIEDYLSEKVSHYKIYHAKNFKEANQFLDNLNITLNIILLDISLPDKDGEELVKLILQKAQDIPVIVLTGNNNIDFSIKSITFGVADYLIKDELEPTILYKSIIYAIERKKVAIDLKKSEKKFSDLFYLNPQPMLVCDFETFQILQANSAALELYLYNNEDFIQLNFKNLFTEESKASLLNSLSNKSLIKGRFYHLNATKNILIVELFSRLVEDQNQKLLFISVNDITDKIRIDETITKAIIKTQEDERFEIGGELHDNICQILAASKMFIGLLKSKINKEDIHLLNQSKDAIDSAIKEVRNLSHRLAPTFFDETSIVEAFQRLFNIFSLDQKCTFNIKIDQNITSKKFNRDVQINLYRILQEQLRNIQKYAQATKVEFEFAEKNQQLFMRTFDNGNGFIVDQVNHGIGLANMKRRTELLNGSININSFPQKGTEIIVTIPLT